MMNVIVMKYAKFSTAFSQTEELFFRNFRQNLLIVDNLIHIPNPSSDKGVFQL
jgi:hypothetical protein